MTFFIYDSLSREKKKFNPIDSNNIRIYACGPTVYSYAHIGNALSDSFLRRLWYEFREDLYKDKETYFEENYTLHSCRAYYINKRLELGVKPVFVAKLVGHSIKTMEKHYENIKLRQLTSELVSVKKKDLEEIDFQTFDMDFL